MNWYSSWKQKWVRRDKIRWTYASQTGSLKSGSQLFELVIANPQWIWFECSCRCINLNFCKLKYVQYIIVAAFFRRSICQETIIDSRIFNRRFSLGKRFYRDGHTHMVTINYMEGTKYAWDLVQKGFQICLQWRKSSKSHVTMISRRISCKLNFEDCRYIWCLSKNIASIYSLFRNWEWRHM